jgi:hypothetical protein
LQFNHRYEILQLFDLSRKSSEAFAQAMLEIYKPIEERQDWINVSSSDYFAPSESSSPGTGYTTPVVSQNSSSTAANTNTVNIDPSTVPPSAVVSTSTSSSSVSSIPSKQRLLDTINGNTLGSSSQYDTNPNVVVSTTLRVPLFTRKHKKNKFGNNTTKGDRVKLSETLYPKVAQRLPLDQLLAQMIQKSATEKTMKRNDFALKRVTF